MFVLVLGSSLDHASTEEYNLTNQRQVHPVQVPGTPSSLWRFIMTIEKKYVAVAIRKGNLKNSQNGFSNSSTLVSAGDIIGKSGSKKNSHFAISSLF